MPRFSMRDFVRRIRDADNVEEAERLAAANMSKTPEGSTGETREGITELPREHPALDDLGTGSHTHIYLGGDERGKSRDDPVDPATAAAAAPATLEGRVEALEGELGEMRDMLEQLLGNDEEDVELEGENEDGTYDRRPFKMYRGAAMRRRAGDELDVPEVRPEMMGATDLPGTEDLDERMHRQNGDRRRTGDRARFRDSADMEENWQSTMAAAEIIVPGVRLPTFDARLEPTRTAERLCAFRRRVMDAAFQADKTAVVVRDFGGITSRDQIMGRGDEHRGAIHCDTLRTAFFATAAALRGATNDGLVRREVPIARIGDGVRTKPPSLAEMNKNHRDFWKGNPDATRH